MKQLVLIGKTDYTVLVKIRTDAGAPATGLDEGDIDIAYSRVETDNDVTTADVTPAALSALTDAHTDWGFEEVSATDHPGVYRLDIADAVFASGAWSAVVSITGTGLDPCEIEFLLVAWDPQAAYALASVATEARLAKLADGGFTAATFAAGAINAAAIAAAAIDAATFATDTDVYTAKGWLQRKSTATANDTYVVVWLKNGVEVTSGITLPTIQVVKVADGTDLIAETAMIFLDDPTNARPELKYVSTAALQTAGTSYVVVFGATIDGSARTYRWPQGRDV